MIDSAVEREFKGLLPVVARLYPDRLGTPLGDLFIEVCTLTQACLMNNADRNRISILMTEVDRIVDECMELLPKVVSFRGQDSDRTTTIACKAGCSHCCSMRVTTTPIEAIAIAEHLRAASRIEHQLLHSLDAYIAATESLPAIQRLQLSMECPFLHNHLCSIYQVRPKTCRTWHSFDLQRCIDDKKNPAALVGVPHDERRKQVGNVVYDAMRDACETLGLEFRMIEFIPAVNLAIRDQTLINRWLKGEVVFEEAHRQDLIAASELSNKELVVRHRNQS